MKTKEKEESKEIAVAPAGDNAIALSFDTMSRDQIELIKRTVAIGSTDDELKLFVHKCATMKVDPLDKLVYFSKYTNEQSGETSVAFISSIDFFRSRAFATGLVDGIQVDIVRDAKGGIYSAVATLHRKDMKFPVVAEAVFSEYNTGRRNWRSMPTVMIKKCAEVMAYRMAFADALHGVYIREEMDQAEGKEYAPASSPEKPKAAAKPKVVEGKVVINYNVVPTTKSKKYDGKLWTEVPLEDLQVFAKHFENKQVDEKGGPIEANIGYYREICNAILISKSAVEAVKKVEGEIISEDDDSLAGSRSDPETLAREEAEAQAEEAATVVPAKSSDGTLFVGKK